MDEKKIFVSSEVGTLRRLIVHSPDAGIGKVVPRKSQDWLYDDIVDIDIMRKEYNQYLQVLLWVLDPDKIKGKELDDEFFKPSSKNGYFNSDKVIDIERLLIRILEKKKIKRQLITHIGAVEKLSLSMINRLMKMEAATLARVLISGVISKNHAEEFVFPPVPNLIFTRDIGITVNDHLLLTKPSETARTRESIITKYIAYYELFASNSEQLSDKVIELEEHKSFLLDDPNQKITVEGGDVMMIGPRHLFIGMSVRTSARGVEKVVKQLFYRNVLDKVSVITIPPKRDYMHIDTVFTQVRRDMWVVYGRFAGANKTQAGSFVSDVLTQDEPEENKVSVTQFIRRQAPYDKFKIEVNDSIGSLEELLRTVSIEEYGCNQVDIIYCANNQFPYDEREQWTDACNLLALREGVVIGYDRNPKTIAEFKKRGFQIIKAAKFIERMERGESADIIFSVDTLILLPSSELSRARGGSHCMSFPLLRDVI